MIKMIDLINKIGFTDIIKYVTYLHLLFFADQITESTLQKKEQEKADALRIIASILVKDN
jgi:hypothetical protein